jgi:hypothetical protein
MPYMAKVIEEKMERGQCFFWALLTWQRIVMFFSNEMNVISRRVNSAILISKHANLRTLATQGYCVNCKAKREMKGENRSP